MKNNNGFEDRLYEFHLNRKLWRQLELGREKKKGQNKVDILGKQQVVQELGILMRLKKKFYDNRKQKEVVSMKWYCVK